MQIKHLPNAIGKNIKMEILTWAYKHCANFVGLVLYNGQLIAYNPRPFICVGSLRSLLSQTNVGAQPTYERVENG